MGKNKKKGDKKDSNDPIKLKELGNKAYINKNYEEAVELYSKAIEIDPKDPVFYSNRATSLFELEKFDDCILDCDKCIELNPQFVKAYFRKALALREKLDDVQAVAVLEKGLEFE